MDSNLGATVRRVVLFGQWVLAVYLFCVGLLHFGFSIVTSAIDDGPWKTERLLWGISMALIAPGMMYAALRVKRDASDGIGPAILMGGSIVAMTLGLLAFGHDTRGVLLNTCLYGPFIAYWGLMSARYLTGGASR